MRALALIAFMVLPIVLRAQSLVDQMPGVWAIGSVAACVQTPYQVRVWPVHMGRYVAFRDRFGKENHEFVVSEQQDGFSTSTVVSSDVQSGTRWDYLSTGVGQLVVRNLASGRQFALVRCNAPAQAQGGPTPTFTDPVALITWLIEHSGNTFNYSNEAASVNVFSPGLRSAVHSSFLRSRQRNEPPCGANGDFILETQEGGPARNLRIALQQNPPDRATVTAEFDLEGYHRNRRYMTVLLDGTWKLENIIETDGTSLRRSLDCR